MLRNLHSGGPHLSGIWPGGHHALKAGQLAQWCIQVLDPAGAFPGLAPLQPQQCQVQLKSCFFHLVVLFVWLAATVTGSRHLRQPDRPASRSNTTLPHPEVLSEPRIMHGSTSRHDRQRLRHKNAHICMRQACPALLDAMPQLDASQTSACSRS